MTPVAKTPSRRVVLLLVPVVAALSAAVALYARGGLRPRPSVNVLLLTIDSLRADHLGAFGYDRATSPAVDALARQGVLFTRTHSQSNWTFGSVPSFITSRYPGRRPPSGAAEQGCAGRAAPSPRKPGELQLLGEGDVTLPAVLQAAGYHTTLVSNHPGLRHIAGLDDGVDDADWLRTNSGVDAFATKVQERLRELADRQPFFLWAYTNDVHHPYKAPPPFDTMFRGDGKYATGEILPFATDRLAAVGEIPKVARLQSHREVDYYVAAYDGCIAAVDHAVGEIVLELQRLKLDQSTLVVLNADHGELLGEEGFYFTHHAALNAASTHVPLLFVLPGRTPAGTPIPGAVSLVDLAPTILELTGVDAAPMAPVGQSLVPCFADPTACGGRRAFASSSKFDRFGVFREPWFLRCGRARPCNLYELAGDAGPLSDRRAEQPTVAAELEQALEVWRTGHPGGAELIGRGPVDPDLVRELRALGYVP